MITAPIIQHLLANFPTELLIKILSYLPTRDRFMMRCVSQRFRDVSEMPLLWKECIWNYEPRHVSSIIKVLIDHGEHVRRILFPAHLTVKIVRKLASHCTQVTHLSLPRDTQLTLDDLEKVVRTMTCLHQLDVFAAGNFIQKDESPSRTTWREPQHIKGLLKVTATSVKELKLRVTQFSWAVRESIKELASQGYTLPIINIFGDGAVFNLPSLWLELHSIYESSLFEISLYDYRKIPMNLYPFIPLKRLKFGPSVTPPFIQLSSYGIVGIQQDIFCISEYNSFGTVMYILMPMRDKLYNSNRIIPISYGQIDSVSCVDFSNVKVDSNHLEQLAAVCPNLQRLNLQRNANCLKHLQGLRAIVQTCQNLKGINLTEISVSQVESLVLLWELLSSLKKLTHLAIDLCLMKASDANSQKLIINMFKTCQCLKALEITRDYLSGCRECTDVTDFFFSYFPSLVYCRMYCFRYSALAYAINNCHKLKYLYEKDARKESILPLSNNCYLEQLCIYSLSLNLTDELVEVLSANGQLERVVLYVKSITINGLTTLINNSPKLTLLHISIIEPFFDDIDGYTLRLKYARPPKIDQQYTDRVKNMFPYRELFAVGNFSVCVIAGIAVWEKLDIDLFDTDLNSLWPSLEQDKF